MASYKELFVNNNKPTFTLYDCEYSEGRVTGYTSEGKFVVEDVLSRNEYLKLYETRGCVWSGTNQPPPSDDCYNDWEDFELGMQHMYMDDHERDFYREHSEEIRELDWRGRI